MSFIFDANEDPKAREARKRQAVMGALQSGALSQATDVGSGLSSLGSALAYRAMQNRQATAAPDPWDGMRQKTGGFSLGGVARALFGGQ